ncbi:hypothetical protein VKT23_014841 [Stygiomarasmius scandens]|uniref:Uncharacterized protein n=1 Tax=Marasmiellus scandens TaxID=2682957 RepID=A0ABR1IZJ0_9AGAR
MSRTRSAYQISRPSPAPVAPRPGLNLSSRRQPPKSPGSPTSPDTSSYPALPSKNRPLTVSSSDQLRQICEESLKSTENLVLCFGGTSDFTEEQILKEVDALPWRRSIRVWKKSTGLFFEFMASTVHEYCAQKFSRFVEDVFMSAGNVDREELPFEPLGCRITHLHEENKTVPDQRKEPNQCWVPIDQNGVPLGVPSVIVEAGYSQTYSSLVEKKSWWLEHFHEVGALWQIVDCLMEPIQVRLVVLINIVYNDKDPSKSFIKIENWTRSNAPAHNLPLRSPHRPGTVRIHTVDIGKQDTNCTPYDIPTTYFYQGAAPLWLADKPVLQIPSSRLIRLKNSAFVLAEDFEAQRKERSVQS